MLFSESTQLRFTVLYCRKATKSSIHAANCNEIGNNAKAGSRLFNIPYGALTNRVVFFRHAPMTSRTNKGAAAALILRQ